MARCKNTIGIATALREKIREYKLSYTKGDLFSAFIVSLVALPLSMALAIAVGLPPQHGLYTAVIAGMVVPLLGGSNWQVSGPTAAFVIVLAPIVTDFGLRGILWAGILAGILIVIMGLMKFGRLVYYIPYPVTTGFTAGIAVVLVTLTLNDFLGLKLGKLPGHFVDNVLFLFKHLDRFDLYTCSVGLTACVILFTSHKIKMIRLIPGSILAVLLATLLALYFTYLGHDVATIGSSFHYLDAKGKVISGVPPYLPTLNIPFFTTNPLFQFPTFEEWRAWLFPACTIAMLAALESLLSAVIADSMTGTKHNPNAELTGIGIGNVLSALGGGIPATGAIARTAMNIHAGGKTPIGSALHAGFILIYLYWFVPYINYIPMSVLAALLIHTAYRMSHYKQFIRILQIAPMHDVVVLLICFSLTVFVDMVAGVGIGILCAAFLLINRITELTQVELEGQGEAEESFLSKLPPGVMVYRIRGPLFFGTIEKAFDRYQFSHNYIQKLILDVSEVPFIDMTALVAIKSMLQSVAHENRGVYIISANQGIVRKIKQKISDQSIKSFVHFCETISDAIKQCT